MNDAKTIDRNVGGGLSATAGRFVVHWGEMGSRWGVNRTMAQVHAVLYLSERPLNAEDLVAMLGVARSNISTSLRELQSWSLVRVVHLMGDRRDHFETSHDVWTLFRTVVRERKVREFDPTIVMLRECIAAPEFAQESRAAQRRMRDTLALMDSLSAWGEEMLRLEPEALMKVMKLGARIRKLLRESGKGGAHG